MKKFDVIGFGALNLDRLYRVERIAKPGEHEKILGAFEAPGGSAANTVAGLAGLGLRTGFVGAVGTDSTADIPRRFSRSTEYASQFPNNPLSVRFPDPAITCPPPLFLVQQNFG